jgi:vacuolar iron transporter family protein
MAKDALKAHARDELGISEITTARPIQAAIASAITFSLGAALPLLVVPFAPQAMLGSVVAAATLAFLALLGLLGARAGGAGSVKPVVRVVFWGAVAMAVTAGVGRIFGAVV